MRFAPIALAVLLLGAVPAWAGPAMTFTLGRLPDSPACGVSCAEFIVARGEIAYTSVLGYVGVRKRARERNLPIILESSGGYLVGARMLARLWREAGLTVIVANAQLACNPADGACGRNEHSDGVQPFRIEAKGQCASACLILLASGTRRFVALEAKIGVHRASVDRNSAAVRVAQNLGSKLNEMEDAAMSDYLGALWDLGIDPALGERARQTSPDKLDWFGRDEALRYRLVNATVRDLMDFPKLAAELRQLEPIPMPRSPAR